MKIVSLFILLFVLMGCGKLKELMDSDEDKEGSRSGVIEGTVGNIHIFKPGDMFSLYHESRYPEYTYTTESSIVFSEKVNNLYGVPCLKVISQDTDKTKEHGVTVEQEARVNKSLIYQDSIGAIYGCGEYEDGQTEPTFMTHSAESPDGIKKYLHEEMPRFPMEAGDSYSRISYWGDDNEYWNDCTYAAEAIEVILIPAGKFRALRIKEMCIDEEGDSSVCVEWFSRKVPIGSIKGNCTYHYSATDYSDAYTTTSLSVLKSYSYGKSLPGAWTEPNSLGNNSLGYPLPEGDEDITSPYVPTSTDLFTFNETISIPFNVWKDSQLTLTGLELKTSTEVLSIISAENQNEGLNLVALMANEWNQALDGITFFQTPINSTSNKIYDNLLDYRDDEIGIYQAPDWFDELSPAALAITQYFGILRNKDTNDEYLELIHADIILNTKEISFSNDPSDTSSYDIQSIILHEMGHFLGLPHNEESFSVMAPQLGSDQVERNIYPSDVNNIIDRYSSLLTGGTVEALTSEGYFSEAATKPAFRNDVVRGIMELRSGGKCYHYMDKKLVKIH